MSRQQKTALAIIALTAAALRLYQLADLSLWLDEATSIEVASRPLRDIAAGAGFDRHTPPFYYLLLHLWFYAAPANEWGLRLLSVCCDTGALLLLFAAVRRHLSLPAAYLAALIYTVSPFAVYYAQEGRMYALVMLQAALIQLCAVLYLQRSLGAAGKIAAVAAAVSGAYTHYYIILYLGAVTAALCLMLRAEPRRLFGWLTLMALSALCFVPWLQVVLSLAGSGGQTFRKFTFLVLPYAFLRFSAGYAVLPLNYGTKDDLPAALAAHWPQVALYTAVFAAVLGWGSWMLMRRRSRDCLLWLLPLLLPGLAALLISMKVPMLGERYLSVSYPCFAAVLAFGLAASFGSAPGKLAAACVLGLSLLGLQQHYFSPNFGKTQWRHAAEFIAGKADARKLVFVNPPFCRFLADFYLPDEFALLPAAEDNAAQLLIEDEFWLVERGTAQTLEPAVAAAGFRAAVKQLYPLENGIRVFYFQRVPRTDTQPAPATQ